MELSSYNLEKERLKRHFSEILLPFYVYAAYQSNILIRN